ncbi:MAG: Maf family nucleotide pyrophosphatase [Burkholderiales bacterium]|nr:Maf family nucleotide pyrophosphatase [Burkholderiales bacterium]
MALDSNIIYLVSASPRRRELLKQIGVHFETLLLRSGPDRGVDVDETPTPGESVEDYVGRIAVAKATWGWRRIRDRRLPAHPALAADTAVCLSGEIFGKPGNPENALDMLKKLSGREHEVLTAVACVFGERLEIGVSRSRVRFCELTDREMRDYVATGEPMDKAGGYAIQGRAARFVERMEGSYSGVMGLPLFETGQLLRKIGQS